MVQAGQGTVSQQDYSAGAPPNVPEKVTYKSLTPHMVRYWQEAAVMFSTINLESHRSVRG